MKIVVLDGHGLNPGDLSWDELAALGDFTCYEHSEPDKVVENIADNEIIITNKTVITADILASCPGIKYICILATGYNTIDIAAAAARGIPVSNIPAYSTEAVAQHVFAHLLNITNQVQQHDASVHNGDWETCRDFCYWLSPLTELTDKTIGIIGFGQTGQAVARIAAAFGMKVLVFTRTIRHELEHVSLRFCDLDELLRSSDVISLHCPLTPDTEGLISHTQLAQMKPEAILINTSRGGVVVEEDLAAALNNGTIRAAAVDVVSAEPIQKDNPLLRAKNCHITPHIAWAPIETRKRLLSIAIENVRSYLAGKPQNQVNRE